MVFASPIWLLALVPWAALALWMLWGQREQTGVPFLALWGDDEARPRTTRSARPPPLAVVMVLLAILLAILAAASPALSSAGRSLSVIVDRGMTMSARDGDAYRFQRAAAQLAPHLHGRVTVVTTPPSDVQTTDGVGFLDAVRRLSPTAVDTSEDVAQAAIRMLATASDAVIVLSDQEIPLSDARLVVIHPIALRANVGITHIAARDKPAVQVMVRLRNQSPATRASVVVSSDDQRIERTIDLPPTTQEATAFIDVPKLGRTVEVALAQGDALSADDRAWLVRESGWPRIEVIATLPAELARMVNTYRKLRPSRDDARVVSIVTDPNDVAGEAVILAPADAPIGDDASPEVADHPVTSGVAWPEVLKGARVGTAAPGGFAPVAQIGKRAAVAVRELPSRQVWIALDADTFPRRADYVVFWTNVFDWLGQGGDAYTSHPVGLLGSEWQRVTDGPNGTESGLWPGLHRRGDGALRAVNAPSV
ncbi:MAG: hypothetical protein WBD40_15915, partial [Tepidisphaeraceae bacterium]